MQQVEDASYLRQIVVLLPVSTDPCISVNSDHGWTFDEQGKHPPVRATFSARDARQSCRATLAPI